MRSPGGAALELAKVKARLAELGPVKPSTTESLLSTATAGAFGEGKHRAALRKLRFSSITHKSGDEQTIAERGDLGEYEALMRRRDELEATRRPHRQDEEEDGGSAAAAAAATGCSSANVNVISRLTHGHFGEGKHRESLAHLVPFARVSATSASTTTFAMEKYSLVLKRWRPRSVSVDGATGDILVDGRLCVAHAEHADVIVGGDGVLRLGPTSQFRAPRDATTLDLEAFIATLVGMGWHRTNAPPNYRRKKKTAARTTTTSSSSSTKKKSTPRKKQHSNNNPRRAASRSEGAHTNRRGIAHECADLDEVYAMLCAKKAGSRRRMLVKRPPQLALRKAASRRAAPSSAPAKIRTTTTVITATSRNGFVRKPLSPSCKQRDVAPQSARRRADKRRIDELSRPTRPPAPPPSAAKMKAKTAKSKIVALARARTTRTGAEPKPTKPKLRVPTAATVSSARLRALAMPKVSVSDSASLSAQQRRRVERRGDGHYLTPTRVTKERAKLTRRALDRLAEQRDMQGPLVFGRAQNAPRFAEETEMERDKVAAAEAAAATAAAVVIGRDVKRITPAHVAQLAKSSHPSPPRRVVDTDSPAFGSSSKDPLRSARGERPPPIPTSTWTATAHHSKAHSKVKSNLNGGGGAPRKRHPRNETTAKKGKATQAKTKVAKAKEQHHRSGGERVRVRGHLDDEMAEVHHRIRGWKSCALILSGSVLRVAQSLERARPTDRLLRAASALHRRSDGAKGGSIESGGCEIEIIGLGIGVLSGTARLRFGSAQRALRWATGLAAAWRLVEPAGRTGVEWRTPPTLPKRIAAGMQSDARTLRVEKVHVKFPGDPVGHWSSRRAWLVQQRSSERGSGSGDGLTFLWSAPFTGSDSISSKDLLIAGYATHVSYAMVDRQKTAEHRSFVFAIETGPRSSSSKSSKSTSSSKSSKSSSASKAAAAGGGGVAAAAAAPRCCLVQAANLDKMMRWLNAFKGGEEEEESKTSS